MGFCNCSVFCVHYFVSFHLDGEKRVGCFALFVFLLSGVALPQDATDFVCSL